MAEKDFDAPLFEFALRMGDNTLVLGQRVSEWCGHAPVLEEDIALANVALDLIGQSKLWLTLAGEIEGKGRDADALAFLRDVRAFRNCLLVEQPNGDFGYTLMRQFLFDAWHLPMLKALMSSSHERIAEIAEKSSKEAAYHLERSEDLIIRLGDGSEESNGYMKRALAALWPFAGELTEADKIDQELLTRKVVPDLSEHRKQYKDYTARVFKEAHLSVAEDAPLRKGGKTGNHSEELGRVLSDMQWLQRAYPGAVW